MHFTSLRSRALVAAGALALAVPTGLMILTPSASAAVTDVKVTTSNPTLAANADGQDYGSVTFTETGIADTPAGSSLCISVDPGSSFAWDLDGAAPTVAATKGAVAEFTSRTAADLKIKVTTASTAAGATFTINGLRADVGATTGNVTAKAGDCVATPIASDIKVATVAQVGRLGGSNRYATAQKVAEANFACEGGNSVVKGKSVIIARGDNYPDALAASYLAGKNDVPILLAAPTSLPNETINALQHIGADQVVIVGGTSAIGTNVETLLGGLFSYKCDGTSTGTKLTVDRAFGADRYATAANVANKGNVVGTADKGLDDTCNAVPTAIIASGEGFADALAAGPLAYGGSQGTCGDKNPIPLLLTAKSSLPAATSAALSDQGIKQVILMGGTAAVTDAVKTAIANVGGVDAISVTRIAGDDRQGTAVELSKRLGSAGVGYNGKNVYVARGDDFPDALAAAPAAGMNKSPLFLTASKTSLGTVSSNGIKAYPGVQFDSATLLGGADALSQAVANDVLAALGAQT